MNTEPSANNPYVGPRSFTYADRRRFFGREREARDLLGRVLSERLLLFYAQSGAGKSSLLHTRLIPHLQEEAGFVVLPVARVSGDLPIGVTAVDNIYLFNVMLSIDEGNDPARLAQVTLGDFLARLTRRTVEKSSGPVQKGWFYDASIAMPAAAPVPGARRYALIVDQFEEIITAHTDRWREREGFFRQLDAAMDADPNLWVVLTLREDYVASLDPYASFMADHLRARFYMERMNVVAALDAICRPAELGRRPFGAGVAEKLVNDLRQERVAGQTETVAGQYVEPVQLQVVCFQLWERLDGMDGLAADAQDGQAASAGAALDSGNRTITHADLAAAGDVDSALAKFYESAIAQVIAQPALKVSEQQLRTWFSTRLITEAGTRGTVFRDERSGVTAGLPNAAVDALARQFLLRTEVRAGGAWVELVHDRFVDPILRANRARQTPLALDAEAWLAAGRNPQRLYRDEKLREALLELEAHPEQFGDKERTFLDVAQKAQTGRDSRQRQLVTGVAAALVLLFAVLAGAAWWNAQRAYDSQLIAEDKAMEAARAQETAEQETERADEETARAAHLAREVAAARADQLGVLAQAALRNGNYPESLLLAVEAISTTLTSGEPANAAHRLTVDRVFHEAMVDMWAIPSMSHGGSLYDVVFSPDDRWLATTGTDSAIRLWATDNPLTSSVVLTGHASTVFDLDFNQDGTLLASAGGDKLVGLWRAGASPELIRLLPGHTDGVARVLFSQDGSWLASASSDSTIRLWNVRDLPAAGDGIVLLGHEGRVSQVAFSPDGQQLASAGADGAVRLWQVSDPSAPPQRFEKGALISALAFSPDGTHLAAGGADNAITVWSLDRAAASPQQLAGHSSAISSMIYSPNGRWLATADFQGTVIIWAVEPALSEIARQRLAAGVDYITFSDHSEWLATADRAGMVDLIAMNTPRAEPIRVRAHDDYVFAVDFSDDNQWLASAGFDGFVRLYPLDLQDQLRMACATISRNFTASEWARHFGEAPYRSTCSQWPVHDSVVQALRDKAVTLATTGRLVEAVEQFQQYLSLAPDVSLEPQAEADRIYRAAQAQDLLARGRELAAALDVAGATALFQQAQELDPAALEDAEAEARRIAAGKLVEEAQQRAGELDLAGATASLEQAAALDPRAVDSPTTAARRMVAGQTVLEAQAQAASGDIDGAIARYEEALALGADLALEPRLAAQIGYGRGLLQRNAYLDALATLDAALVISPTYNVTGSLAATDWDDICRYGTLLDRAADVLPACARATALADSTPRFHANRATALAMVDDLAGAIGELEHYLALAEAQQSDDAAVLVARRGWLQALRAGVNPIRASILTRTGRYEEAAPIYAALRQLEPPLLYTPDEMNNVCWYGALAGHAAAVLYMCDWALLLRPTDANYFDSRGLARAATGDLTGALQDFNSFLNAGNNLPEVTRQRREAWSRALEAGHNPVLAYIQAYNGEIDPALTAYTAMNDADVWLPADEWNHLCWYGALHGRAARVLFACDLAVESTPGSANYHDSRALARALSGEYLGAAEDYRFTVEQADPRFTSRAYLTRRRLAAFVLEFLGKYRQT